MQKNNIYALIARFNVIHQMATRLMFLRDLLRNYQVLLKVFMQAQLIPNR